ncbi:MULTISPECIES: type I 3-dehydroquinate dehydratase [Vagococcus]|uniref:3-dehydroquinate dehydratase n=1 Tax=Vagococcus fluvialis bH819 TaxID=1255619 RepID=A0A1X6WNH7_9ENTE|nr:MULTISPECIES: type I 3-dehydroquinate dehydratase [Vagococcus]SLM85881.1 3-dehydroquinate dehydratase I [Vagococcus fluvialis bH819]HCM90302.1 type I 3-dehydroquinate dehydratase [Vagococcus sp.]
MSKLKVRNITLGSEQPKVCVSLIASNFEELFAEAMRISRLDCDVIEWRADYFMYVNDISFMRKAAYFIRYAIEDKPLIFTFRTLGEGGGQYIEPEYYFELNRYMVHTGLVDVIDLELALLTEIQTDVIHFAKQNNVKVLISSHDYQGTPNENQLTEMIYDMRYLGADISKIAVTPNDMQDVLTILQSSNKINTEREDVPFVIIGMGEVGRLTRLTGELFGSVLTFASSGKYNSAPGQIPIPELRRGLDVIGKRDEGVYFGKKEKA